MRNAVITIKVDSFFSDVLFIFDHKSTKHTVENSFLRFEQSMHELLLYIADSKVAKVKHFIIMILFR